MDEASDLLLGDQLCGKSQTIQWVDECQPHNRKCRLKDHSKLQEIREQDPNTTNIFEPNLVHKFYPKRPDEMEDVCLYDFVANTHTKSGVDKNGRGQYRKLHNGVLPNHKMFNPSRENERESYYYSLLLLFVPFHNEGELIEKGENAEDVFNRHMKQNSALNTHSEKLQRMLKAKENVENVNKARQAAEENVPMSEPMEEDEGPQVAGEATSAVHDVANLQANEDGGPSLEELVSSLNTDQARIFECIKEHFEHQVQYEKNMGKCSDLKPLNMFVSGVGGMGKSFLIKTIRALVSIVLHNQSDSLLCAVTAPAGLMLSPQL